jgi:hypothetical protein
MPQGLNARRAGSFHRERMSARRQPPPPRPISERERGEPPAVSGEYRIVRPAATTTTTSLPAVRVPTPPHPVTGATHRGPARSTKPRADASGPPLSAGRELHDLDFDFDFEPATRAGGALELDGRPSSHRTRVETSRPSTLDGASPGQAMPAPMRRVTPAPMRRATPPPMRRVTPAPMQQATPAPMQQATPPPMRRATPAPMRRVTPAAMPAVDAHASLVAFSGFGNPPSSLFGTPIYALRVMLRRRALRRDLAHARLRHSHDVGFYEAALRTADDEAVRRGIFLTVVFFTMVTALVATVLHVASGALVLRW